MSVFNIIGEVLPVPDTSGSGGAVGANPPPGVQYTPGGTGQTGSTGQTNVNVNKKEVPKKNNYTFILVIIFIIFIIVPSYMVFYL